jgi:hypothetical protein
MPLLHRFLLLAVVTAAGFVAFSGSAFAAFSRDGSLPFTLDSTNFRVHYHSDKDPAAPISAITETEAGDIAALAERALTAELADGFARPLSDGGLGGDGRIDIYIEDYTTLPGVIGSAGWDVDGLTSSGFIELAGNNPEQAFTQHNIAHELFHLVQFGIWIPRHLWNSPLSASDAWLLEASAEWMGFRVDGYPAVDASGLGPSDMALDCRDPFGGTSNKCDLTDDYLGNGYSRWPFFEYVSETYGTSLVKDIFSQGFANNGTNMTAIGAVAAALTTKGTTLADAYNAWTRAEVSSSYSIPSLQAVKPTPYGAPIFTGVESGLVTAQKVTANHLSTRFLEFVRGRAVGGSTASVCWKATLSITVTFPVATLSQPVFYWDGSGHTTVPLSVSGNTATASIPWDTCTWASGEGFLALPNASQNVDAADFDVSARLDVDSTTQVTSILPVSPPPPAIVTSPVIPVSSADVAPTLEVFGPQLITLSSTSTQIRLIVNASGEGLASAALGSLALGTVSLRAGNNDVRFTVPKGTLAALRRSAAASNVLTVTPTAASGNAIGTPITRTIAVTSVSAKKAHVKKKPKAKAPATKAKHAK